ncbi:hypothetical protein BRETT_003330 [Brettanomyces bruxellensis]|mgnify:CR=1 FL=1|uniref:Low-affinity Fe(2+) transport protein n=1 Tax=Dekkera bruxellensis TaxID=5007 RepID=A0A871RBB2_DEKBR|nr:uncharacterized protein BRETT_003330 [Brettanomyces bruxellensis]QOU23139.1 hypothetical protein BRETT_003330 [Brettanomyces bruxellensis]
MGSTRDWIKRSFVPRQATAFSIQSTVVQPSSTLLSPISREVSGISEKEKDEFSEYEIDQFQIKEEDDLLNHSYIDVMLKIFVRWAGSITVFCIASLILILWIVIGIVYKAPETWQIIMQDGQSIQCYIWDTLLMRQQLDDSDRFLAFYGRLKSRFSMHKQLLTEFHRSQKKVHIRSTETPTVDLAEENWFDRQATLFSKILGSAPAIILYWIGVFVWVGCGALKLKTDSDPPYTGRYSGSNPEYVSWSDVWQMYINTAVAVVLLISSVVLQNVRARNNKFVRNELNKVSLLDSKIEGTSRYLTGNMEPNKEVEVLPCKRKGFEKVISFYAAIIGSGIGLAISVLVFIVWLAIGHLMQWDSNWWLIIGTYTGLVGYIDGFTLRETFRAITAYDEAKFDELLDDSQELLTILGIDYQLQRPSTKFNIQQRISVYVSNACSSKYSVMASVFTVVALLVIASGLKWSVTGQLICNSPTMIIEGFCLLILIQAHVWADYQRRFTVRQLAISRTLIARFLDLEVSARR